MDRSTHREAVTRLQASEPGPEGSSYAHKQALLQFNALLRAAKELYLQRHDIPALDDYPASTSVGKLELTDAIYRLYHAVAEPPPSSAVELLDLLQLPPDAPSSLNQEIDELRSAVKHELPRASLLLAGALAEALLLTRHPDSSAWGPGLVDLLRQAKAQKLFGRDTLRALESLVDYRDLIHARAASRNRTPPNMTRVDTAVAGLKLLCSDLQDTSLRYSP